MAVEPMCARRKPNALIASWWHATGAVALVLPMFAILFIFVEGDGCQDQGSRRGLVVGDSIHFRATKTSRGMASLNSCSNCGCLHLSISVETCQWHGAAPLPLYVRREKISWRNKSRTVNPSCVSFLQGRMAQREQIVPHTSP